MFVNFLFHVLSIYFIYSYFMFILFMLSNSYAPQTTSIISTLPTIRFVVFLADGVTPRSHSRFILEKSRVIFKPAGFQCDAGCVDGGGDLHGPRRAVRTTIIHGGYGVYSKRALVLWDRTTKTRIRTMWVLWRTIRLPKYSSITNSIESTKVREIQCGESNMVYERYHSTLLKDDAKVVVRFEWYSVLIPSSLSHVHLQRTYASSFPFSEPRSS